MTGLSEKALKRAGLAYEKVYVHPASHAGYYPGATQMSLKLLFDPENGKILGAQCVGADGVDKRIDVLAVAIRAGMTVYDLEKLELAYAPPFGSAKDPVNYAGFVAANVLRKEVRICHVADVVNPGPNQVILDVRTAPEVQQGTIPGSIHIPLDELREPAGRAAQGQGGPGLLPGRPAGLSGLPHPVPERHRLPQSHGRIQDLRPCHGADVRQTQGPARGQGGYRTDAGPGHAASERRTTATSRSSRRSTPAACSARAPSCSSNRPWTRSSPARPCGSPSPNPPLPRTWTAGVTPRAAACGTSSSTRECSAPWWRKATSVSARGHPSNASRRQLPTPHKTLVVFSDAFDKAMAAFIIANGAAAMGSDVTMFFTFWGLNLLRRPQAVPVRKTLIERMFGWMMPRGADKTTLSKMNMAGMGTAMIKGIMKKKNVLSLPELIAAAQQSGVRLVACTMTMDLMGIKREELIDGVEEGGVAMYLDEAGSANVNLFIG